MSADKESLFVCRRTSPNAGGRGTQAPCVPGSKQLR